MGWCWGMGLAGRDVCVKVWECRRYGKVELVEVAKPVVGEGELLVRVVCTTVTAGDWRVRAMVMPRGMGVVGRLALGVRGPRQRVLGTEMAGVVEAAGGRMGRFSVGDEVMVFGGMRMGCHAEYRVVREGEMVVRKPGHVSFEEAAAVGFGGHTAMHFLRKGEVKAGEKVLVVGASGGVGTAMVQLAKHLGAEVVGVTSTGNVELVRGLGADRVVDYKREDWRKLGEGGERFDVVADVVGAGTVGECQRLLREGGRGGRVLAVAGGVPEMLAAVGGMIWRGRKRGGKVIAGPAEERVEDWERLAELLGTGVLRAVIDRRYGFEEMEEAYRYVETGRKRGSVVVRVGGEG